MSQVQAAVAAGVARATLQNAEAGRFTPRADALARIADLYGVTIDSLFIHTPDADTPSVAGEESPNNHEPGAASDSSGARLAHTGG